MFDVVKKILGRKRRYLSILYLVPFFSYAQLQEGSELLYYLGPDNTNWIANGPPPLGLYADRNIEGGIVFPIKSLAEIQAECPVHVGDSINDYIPPSIPPEFHDIVRDNAPSGSRWLYSTVISQEGLPGPDGLVVTATGCFLYLGVDPSENPCAAGGRIWNGSACVVPPLVTEQDDPVNLGDSEHQTCRPVNIATGNKFFVQTDFVGTGINPLRFTLFYNSNGGANVWSGEYRQRLDIATDSITVIRSNGQRMSFMINGGVITAPSQIPERLAFNTGTNTYSLTLTDNTLERYNAGGQLQSIRYPSGLTHSLSYTADTITVTRRGESLLLTLTDNNVTSATLPDSTVINYSYDVVDGISRLLQITYPDTRTQTYFYENADFPSHITGIEDGNAYRIASVQYDAQGRAISSEAGPIDSGIERTQIQYNADGTRTLTNALGKQNVYHFTQFNGEHKLTQVEGLASANCAAANQNYTYDSNGFRASVTDWNNNVTTFINNERGQVISRTEASGTPEERTITAEWHAEFYVPTKITEPERETIFIYDSNGRLLSRQVQPRTP